MSDFLHCNIVSCVLTLSLTINSLERIIWIHPLHDELQYLGWLLKQIPLAMLSITLKFNIVGRHAIHFQHNLHKRTWSPIHWLCLIYPDFFSYWCYSTSEHARAVFQMIYTYGSGLNCCVKKPMCAKYILTTSSACYSEPIRFATWLI